MKILLKKDPDIQKIMTSLRKTKTQATIMVITPYRAQVNLLRSELIKEHLSINLKVDTVDAFQGKLKPYDLHNVSK